MMISEYSNMAMTLQVPQIQKNKKQSNQGRHEKLSKKKKTNLIKFMALIVSAILSYSMQIKTKSKTVKQNKR